MRRSIVLMCALLLVPVLAAAQAELEAKREHMKSVAFMVGEWTGEGWIVAGPDGPQRFSSYTVTIDDQGRWTEIGETSTDGEIWRKFFEMTLQRVE